MATVALTTTDQLEVIVPPPPEDIKSLTAGADISAGTFVQENTSGNWIQALADTTGHAAGARLALKTVKSGQALDAARTGVFGGFTISQAYNAALFLSDTGTLADAAGTVSVAVGRVRAAAGNVLSGSRDKVIALDCPV